MKWLQDSRCSSSLAIKLCGSIDVEIVELLELVVHLCICEGVELSYHYYIVFALIDVTLERWSGGWIDRR